MKVAFVLVLAIVAVACVHAEEVTEETEKRPAGFPRGSTIMNNAAFKAIQILFGKNGKTRDKDIKLKLLYRASRDGWYAQTTHSRINGRGATLTLYRSTNGGLFGGYYSKSWISRNNYNYQNVDSWVFRLRRGWGHITPFKVLCGRWCNRYRVYDHYCYQPTFGGGHDLFGGGSCWGTGHRYFRGGYHYKWMYNIIARGYPGAGHQPPKYWMGGSFWYTKSDMEVYKVTGVTAAEKRALRLKRERAQKKETKKKKEKRLKKIRKEKKKKADKARERAKKLKARQDRLERAQKKLALTKSLKKKKELTKKVAARNRRLRALVKKQKAEEARKVINKKKRVERDLKRYKKALKSRRAFKRVTAREKLIKARAAYRKSNAIKKLERLRKAAVDKTRKIQAKGARAISKIKRTYWARGFADAAKTDARLLDKMRASQIKNAVSKMSIKTLKKLQS